MNESNGGGGVSRVGKMVAVLAGVDYTFDACAIATQGVLLSINLRYDDFEAALAGQSAGDSDAFFVEVSYVTHDECSQYPFTPPPYPTQRWVCNNIYRARVTQL
jgi:hypothetical protein